MKQERDHDQGENQKLSLYQAFSLTTLLADYLLLIAYKVAKAEEDNDEKHKPSTQALSYHNVSQLYQDLSFYQAYMFEAPKVTAINGSSSVWSHAQLTLAFHCVIQYPQCVIGKFGHTCKFVLSMSSYSSSLSYSPMHPLESSLLSTLAPSSSSSDENAQSFTLRAPRKLKTTTQVVALNRCC
ncbi:hypothetical protein HID58_019170 [Brassica napus]|uniref:Uncharacterized protein n=1 Tax=Brassica napus TaxID=3708 RepID=A0ABQ8DC07_BRANA|nr:hypothetical protein HID58_019170 [Brassica napus]